MTIIAEIGSLVKAAGAVGPRWLEGLVALCAVRLNLNELLGRVKMTILLFIHQ